MAFATNSSLFNIKPATATSVFGTQQQQPQQQQPGTSAFNLGNAPPLGQSQQQPNIFSGFGQNQQNQPQNQQQGQPLPPGSLFGQPQQQGQQQPQSSLFTSSLFNTTSNAQQQQQQPQQQPQQQNPFAAFGGNTQQQQQPQQGIFGSSTNNPNLLQAQPTLPAAAFGASTNAGGNTGFGTLGGGALFASKSQQPLQQQQQQSLFPNPAQNTGLFNSTQPSNLNASTPVAGPPLFTKSTKFNDLPEDIKRVLEAMDSHIQGRVQICKDLQQRKLGEEPTKGHTAIRGLHKELVNTATAIRDDLHLTQDLKDKVNQAVEDTIVATRIVDGFRNPQSGNTYLKDHAGFPLEYFTRVTDQMKERLAWYQSTIDQIERKLSSSQNSAQTPQGISATLQAQHATFLALASKTAAVDTELQKIKALYTQLWRAKTGSVRDPFNELNKSTENNGDFGLGSLNVR